MRSISAVTLLAFSVLAAEAALACSSSSDRQCSIGADCASGACNADGTCVAVGSNGADSGGPSADGGGTNDGSDASYTIDASSLACASGTDGGVLGHDNVPLAAGLEAKFKVATSETVDTTGTDNGDGSKTWDFSGALGSDQDVIVQTTSPSGTWWTADYSNVTYATKLAQGSNFLGLFDYTADALELVGVVSPTNDGMTETEVTYATPIPILQFPLHDGQTWTTTSNVTGTYNGLPGQFYTEKYDSKIDGHGTVKTPYGSFPALRVGTLLTHTYGGIIQYTRTYAWVTACFGTVAKATSASTTYPSDAPGENFTQAAELERLEP